MIFVKEVLLEDEYPVYAGYAYVALGGNYKIDGEVITSDISGTVKQLKELIGANEIYRCDLVARGLLS